MNESSVDQEIRKSDVIANTHEKSGGLYLVEPGLTAGRQ